MKDNDDKFNVSDKVKDFSQLLDQIENLPDKKKRLWCEIYENAILDRQNAYLMFTKLVRIAQDKSTEHAVHGRSLSAYIERMSKANDQLIKLAELIADAETSNDDELDDNDIFDIINNSNAGKKK